MPPRKLKRKKMEDIKCSEEQQDIVDCVKDRKNLLVIAKAGAGKTFTGEQCAKAFYAEHKQRTLVLTYNARLKNESRARIIQKGLSYAMEAHSYHAAASAYFVGISKNGANDSLIYDAIKTLPRKKLDFGLVIIDEAQDMNELYYKFVVHLLKQCNRPNLVLLGDPFQRIFGFNGATTDYLVNPEKYFSDVIYNQPVLTKHLSICWRITHEMAQFINVNLNPINLRYSSPEWWKDHGSTVTAWWGAGIQASPFRPPAPGSVAVFHGWGDYKVIKHAKDMFKTFGNDNVAFLAMSLKNEKSPVFKVINKLGRNKDENWVILTKGSPEDNILKNKRVASTIHKFKGLERKGIVLCGLDSFIEKVNKEPLDHFNLWYVACTRAKEKLVINIAGEDYATMRRFPLKDKHCPKFPCTLMEIPQYVPFDDTLSVKEHFCNTVLATQLPIKDRISFSNDLVQVNGREPGTTEDLSRFINLAVRFKVMLYLGQELAFWDWDDDDTLMDQIDPDMVNWIEGFSKDVKTDWKTLLKYSIAFETMESKYTHYWRQIKCDEITIPSSYMDQCYDNIITILKKMVNTDQVDLGKHVKSECETGLHVPFTWFKKLYSGNVTGFIEFIICPDLSKPVQHLVQINCVGQDLSMEQIHKALLTSSVQRLTQNHIAKTYVLNASCGALHEVSLCLKQKDSECMPEFEYLIRHMCRKTSYDFNNLDLKKALQQYQIFNARKISI